MQILACFLALVLCTFSRAERATAEASFAAAGLRQGDVLLRVNGHELKDPKDALKAMEALDSPEKVIVTVLRDGREQTLELGH